MKAKVLQLENSTSSLVTAEFGLLREIRYTVKDEYSERYKHLKLVHSRHSMKRSQQRGISRRAIILAAMYGSCEFKQGLVYRVVRDADIPESLNSKDRKLIRHLVVILDESERQVITCYRNSKGIRNIRRKPKFLYSNMQAS